jgi:hypothetical protein
MITKSIGDDIIFDVPEVDDTKWKEKMAKIHKIQGKNKSEQSTEKKGFRICIFCGTQFRAFQHASNKRYCNNPECIEKNRKRIQDRRNERRKELRQRMKEEKKEMKTVDEIREDVNAIFEEQVKDTEVPMGKEEIVKAEVQYGHPAMEGHFKQLLDIHRKKDHDYAGDKPLSNFKKSEDFGVPAWRGALIRMADKWSRLCSLAKNEAHVQDETIDDTLDDLAVYAMIVKTLKQEAEKPHEEV